MSRMHEKPKMRPETALRKRGFETLEGIAMLLAHAYGYRIPYTELMELATDIVPAETLRNGTSKFYSREQQIDILKRIAVSRSDDAKLLSAVEKTLKTFEV